MKDLIYIMCLDDSTGIPILKNNYSCFDQRLLSFKTWKLSSPTAIDLSKSGFFYTNSFDTVICFCCKLHLGHWKSTDIVQQEHLKFSPDCAFALLNQSIFHNAVFTQKINESNQFILMWISFLYATTLFIYLLFK